MPTIAELLGWQPDSLAKLADSLFASRRRLKGLQEEINTGKPPESWDAPATPSAVSDYDDLHQRLNDIAAQVSDLAVTVEETSAEVRAARSDLEDALTEADREKCSVNRQTGDITAPPLPVTDFPTGDPRQVTENARVRQQTRERDQRVDQIAADIDRALKRADAADVGLAKAMISSIEYEVRGGDGTIAEAIAAQLPPSLEGLTPQEVAEKLGGDIGLATMKAYLEGEMPLHRWFKAEYGVAADYKVMMDGTVKMSLQVEGGIGVALAGSGGGASLMAGRTGEVELSFKSEEEAERFLSGFEDAATDIDLSTFRTGGGLAGNVAQNIAEYIRDQEVTGLKTGIYAKGEIEFDTNFVKGDANGRIDAYRDFDQDEYGFKVHGTLSGEHKASGVGGSASFTGELKTDLEGTPKSLSLAGEVSGKVAAEKLGIDIPGRRGETGADVELKVDQGNVMWDEIHEAVKRGDMDRATDLAMDHGQVVVKQTAIGGSDFDAKRPEGGIEWGTESKTTQNVWVRDANSNEVVSIDPKTGAAKSVAGGN
ncbi:hypothetical protein ACFWQC_15465 [Nocardioides sp. NPDC058538]|uniref:hypothetical protein n=1 Tax=Nocardioides sp. NPDC058538 TaxID=3346542 RepID=UPI003647E66C